MSTHFSKTIIGQWKSLFPLFVIVSLLLSPISSAYAAGMLVTRLAPDIPTSGASFGMSVAIDGDIAVVGAPFESTAGSQAGAAYVYRRDGRTWVLEAKLVGADTGAYDRFGWSVAVCQQTIVIGAYGDAAAGASSGAAYTFTYDGAQWTQQAKLIPADGGAYDRFGWSVAIDTNLVVVGAYSDSDIALSAGSVYVFARAGSAWSQQAKLYAADAGPFDFFGYAVSISGTGVAIGAPYASDQGANAGLAYVFRHDGAAWLQESRLAPAELKPGDQFGRSIAISADRLLAGAPMDDTLGLNAGMAYSFTRRDGAWQTGGPVNAEAVAAQDMFGSAVALNGGRAVVGAPGDADAGANAGVAYLFDWQDGAWHENQVLAAIQPGPQQRMGTAVAVSRDTMIVGAYGDSVGGLNAGAAYSFLLDCAWDDDQHGDDDGAYGNDQGPDDHDIRPVLECVDDNHDGTFTAHFGYINTGLSVVDLDVGPHNRFASRSDRGQPSRFLPGRHHHIFSIRFAGDPQVWTLNGHTATTVNSQIERCGS